MKLLYFTRSYTPHDHRFLSALTQTEHEIFYLTLERGAALEDRVLPAQVQRLHWSRELPQAGMLDGPRLVFELRRLLRRVRPDVVQAGPIQRTALLTALAGFRPLVSMSWGYDLLIDARRGRAWEWATRYTLQRSAALVGDCDTIRKLAVGYGMPAERIVTFPWGIDLTHFTPAPAVEPAAQPIAEPPAPAGPEPAPFTLLSTRAWEPIYGVDVLSKAFVLAAAERPELRLVMLGGGSQAGLVRQTLARLGETANGLPRVIFPGQVRYADLPNYYRHADLYLAASHSDGSSISLLEALACGCPALVSDIPGNCEWITPGHNGWLFPDGDALALAHAIIRAVDQRHLLPTLAQHARQIAIARADWSHNFPHLLRAYEIALQ